MPPVFTATFTPVAADIDELGHVNNAVWVRWVQDMATGHWQAAARPEDIDAYVWVVIRHEIDYLGNAREGQVVEASTHVGDAPRGAKFDRLVEFRVDGKPVVRARTTWAMIDRASGKIKRVPAETAAPFLSVEPSGG